MLKELLDGCLAHQRPDGLFYDKVDDPSSFVETDLAAMLAYAIYESVRGGWLPESYLAARRPDARGGARQDGSFRICSGSGGRAALRPAGHLGGRPGLFHFDGSLRAQSRPAISAGCVLMSTGIFKMRTPCLR